MKRCRAGFGRTSQKISEPAISCWSSEPGTELTNKGKDKVLSSLVVAPFNSLVTKPGRGVPRVYVNLSKPGSAGVLGWLLRSALNTALQYTTHNGQS